MSPAESVDLEARLAREVGRAWGDLGGAGQDAAIAALAGAVQELFGDVAERTPLFPLRRRRSQPRPVTPQDRGRAR